MPTLADCLNKEKNQMINYSEVEQKLLNKLFIGYPKDFILNTLNKNFKII